MRKTFLIGLAGLAALSSGAAMARPPAQGYVIAESRFGHGHARGAVRPDPNGGLMVELPNGRWEHCRRLCSETLRVEALDYWESHNGRNSVDNEAGIFGPLTLKPSW